MTATLEPSKSSSSYKSTHSSRSGVLERARGFQRKMEEERRTSYVDAPTGNTPREVARLSPSGHRGSSHQQRTPAVVVQPDMTTTSSPLHNATAAEGVRYSPSPRNSTVVPTPSPRNSTTVPTPQSQMTQQTRDSGRSFRSRDSASTHHQQQQQQQQQQHYEQQQLVAAPEQPQDDGPVVSPELLVDALSGHEDGLLAIAERLMEHYDRGYDAMGEAIIDAFADVQKLFQHVVEAAHMEGAAFEASRREEEMKDRDQDDNDYLDDAATGQRGIAPSQSPAGPIRHDEFIDQDVKDCLTDAIRKGALLKEQGKHMDCYELYEMACQNSSSLLPVDSDHRGRLQLSISRAESMSPDRGCAILRYAMDDVVRSGMRAGKVPSLDPSKRADVVLSKPKAHPSMGGGAKVIQSNEEQLNSLVEEMKEILGAPVYKDTPLHAVAMRFWGALTESQKMQNRNEERLEQNLGKLKGDYLLARAEWEEKLSRSDEQTDHYKQKYLAQKTAPPAALGESGSSQMMGDARRMFRDEHSTSGFHSGAGHRSGAQSVASLGSSMAQHAKSLVGNFACAGLNERTDPLDTSIPGKLGPAQQWRERQEQKRQAATNNDLHPIDSPTYESSFQQVTTSGTQQQQTRHLDL